MRATLIALGCPMPELGPSPLAAGNELPVSAARAAIAAALRPITESEQLPLTSALGRVLARDVISLIDVPAHDNSAMDGYAFRGADLSATQPTRLQTVAATVLAGEPFDTVLAPGQCVRIMTGAMMPPGLDTVVPQELCRLDGGQVEIAAGALKAGDNRRFRGEDLARGQPALQAGRQLRPADLGLLASLGLAEVNVMRRLRVALFSTGNELREPGTPLDAGSIYDSNRYSLMGALARLGVEVIDLGQVPDDPAALGATLDRAIASADAVLTSGGVSVGDADYTKDLLASRGEVAFWKVAMRPGRPFAFGPLQGPAGRTAWLFALPGNPVAALVTFYAFARDALLSLAGASPQPLPRLRARSVAPIRKRPGRSEFQRGIVSLAEDGRWDLRLTGAQGAGILRSMTEANVLVLLGHDQGAVAAGDEVEVWLFDGLT
jgi:molybdopterin molybdotransferase